MEKPVYVLKSVHLKNFKNYKDKNIVFHKHTEFYGKNSVGKTAICDAIQFAYKGSKTDTDKITVGENEMEVTLNLEEQTDKTPLVIKRKINRDKKWFVHLSLNGIKKPQPANFIKKLISFGTFNPRDYLKPEGRTERLLQLVPIYIKKDELIMPNFDKPFPINDPLIDYNAHAFNVLKQVDKDLRNTRHSLFTKKDITEKYYNESMSELSDKQNAFQVTYKKSPLEFETNCYEEAIKKQANHESENKDLIKEQKENETQIVDMNEAVKIEADRSNKLEAKRLEHEKQIAVLNNEIKSIQWAKKNIDTSIENYNKKLSTRKENIKKIKESLDKFYTIKEELDKNVFMCKEATDFLNRNSELSEKSKELDEIIKQHGAMDTVVKVEFKKFKENILKPIVEKIKDLEVKEDGFYYKGSPISELSGSEIINLGVEFLSLESNSSFLIINEAEALDKENLDKLDKKWDDKQITIIRVADTPAGGAWQSNKIE